ncbi:ABC transporter substrate-binding protein [Gillisia hiemivivida]|uniref:ABC transporter substrate-binding protein n=1 Tax=Gillisia hiemivivida TaxID=291190 RepID=A0A5C7A316_9FLAO|nr:ABC transporter substrate-binding protein [Gillisia hiemivivida]
MHKLCILLCLIIFSSCKNEESKIVYSKATGEVVPVEYAKGFKIQQFDGYKLMTVKNPWPKADKSFTYLLAEKEANIPSEVQYDLKVTIPVQKIVVTSTTHIPSLEILNEEQSLLGFPGLNYISSEKTRARISKGLVAELGQNESMNTEILISLDPDLVIGFAIDGNNKTFSTIQKSGIPVIYNGDWTEESPLGKAEWIKFFGAFYNKDAQASAKFNEIRDSYLESKELAKNAKSSPTVLSGSMYKDQWYVPYGNSWQAKFIEDANANYIYKDTKGSGSIALSFESVLDKSKDAEYWVAPGQFQSFQQLMETSSHYTQFKAVQDKKVFTYSNSLGTTGGVIYYELAPTRPDLVLKDLISIFHPELLPDYKSTFFKALQ